MPPQEAQDPIAMIAPAFAATVFASSRAVFPPILQ
jgi:hypothetical protein